MSALYCITMTLAVLATVGGIGDLIAYFYF